MSKKFIEPDDGNLAGLDIAAVTRDDEVVEALGLGLPVVADTAVDFELAELLADWRAGVHAAPQDTAITVDDVEHAIAASAAAARPNRAAGRHLRLVAGAAAVIAVALGGLTVLSEGATPNDPLWGVKKVAHRSAAASTQAAFDTRASLEQAEKALAAGKPKEAKELLDRAQSSLTPIADKADRAQMDAWISRLATSIDSAIKASAPAKKQVKKPQVQPPAITDNIPQYTPPPVPQYTPPPVPQYTPPPAQHQVPAPPAQQPAPPVQPAPPIQRPRPRPPISVLPN
ncbi:MAG: anti-sigma-D factor RsdA [Gordonia sp. (in: high G+C Gram-positive bacteria)]|uniref:anti-sigma-D factor RsdA n=1 Tax=Gordonia sp. (in: high G+C Gram-positive bacteria) TaxID=84139 RepID=UPI0039E47F29